MTVALERKRRETEARDCPHCEGERRREGAALSVGDGVFGMWRLARRDPGEGRAMSDALLRARIAAGVR